MDVGQAVSELSSKYARLLGQIGEFVAVTVVVGAWAPASAASSAGRR
jgi:hypothetical protein